MKKKISLIMATAVLLATMLGLIVGLVGCDKNDKDPGEESQNPFQSVLSPETTEKPKKTLETGGANTDDGWSEIK